MSNEGEGVKEIKSIFDAFYSRYILRDLTAKVIPGFIFLTSFSVFLIFLLFDYYDIDSSVSYIIEFYKGMSFWMWIIILALTWVFGFSIQYVGEKFGLIRYYPEFMDNEKTQKLDESTFHRMYLFLQNNGTNKERQEYERFVTIKEATGNSYVSIMISYIIFILFLLAADYMIFNEKPWIIIFISMTVFGIIISLRKMHFIHVDREYSIMQNSECMKDFK